MKVTFRITRFNPEADTAPHAEDYAIDVQPHERVLDALLHIKDTLDPSLAIRRSCAHGVCGSDAMRINGMERLACKTLMSQVAEQDGAVVTVEPLRSMPLQRDLYVDQELFLEKYRSVKPYLHPAAAPPEKEYLQSPGQRAVFDDPTKCILCGACYSACPVVAGTTPGFIGPAAVVNAARFVFDDRDKGVGERLEALDRPEGAWACENHFDCTRVCPRGIKVTKAINQTKRAITGFKEAGHETV
jgi:succinate dehydrogenase / fumarate reductase iron-sulfur subunit